MNKFQTLLSILLVCFLLAGTLSAQEAPPMSGVESAPKSNGDSATIQEPAKQVVAEQEDDDQEDDDQEDDDQEDDDKKSDDKEADDKKADDQEDDDDKDDDKKSDDQEDDDKKSDDKDDDKKAERRLGISRLWGNNRTSTYSKKSEKFVDLFETVVASANESTLQVMSGKRQIALGTVVDADGLVLTKASELRGELGCKLPNGDVVNAEVLGVDPATDLALLKLDTDNLSVIQWTDNEDPPVTGRWVATPKAERKGKFPTIGVVSVNAREIPASRPFIGIHMDPLDDEDGIRITQIVNKSPADLADLRVNDVILKIGDEVAKDPRFLSETLGQYDIGDRVTLTVRRGGKEIKIKLTLAERDKISPDNARSNTQNSMGSVLSRRRKDFPTSFQHDSMLSSSTCGGPIVDLSGKAVGINIARAGRVSSLALTSEVVLPILEKLKTGDYLPAVVNKREIEERAADLEELVAKIGDLPDKKRILERKYSVERARKQEIERMIEELQERLKDITKRTNEERKELDSVRQSLRVLEKNQDNLEKELKELRTGSRF